MAFGKTSSWDRFWAAAARAAFAAVPVAKPTQLAEGAAIIFGTPTRFGNMAADAKLSRSNWRVVGERRAGRQSGEHLQCTASQHGGHGTTLVSFHTTLLHHGMIVVGLPYTEQRLMNMAEITGGTPYGATTLAGIDVHASQAKTSSPSPAFRAGMWRRSPTHWSRAAK